MLISQCYNTKLYYTSEFNTKAFQNCSEHIRLSLRLNIDCSVFRMRLNMVIHEIASVPNHRVFMQFKSTEMQFILMLLQWDDVFQMV